MSRQRENGATNIRERTAEGAKLESTPPKVYVEIAWLCQLRCPSCFHAYVTPPERRAATHFMSPVLFDRVAQQLFPGASQVWFNGNGETLLHPNATEILGAVREYPFLPSLLTSGSSFTEQNMRLLVEAGFYLTISVDSPFERDFERLRKGAKFSRVVEAIDYMQALAAGPRSSPFNLRLQCVAQESNLDQLAPLVQWARRRVYARCSSCRCMTSARSRQKFPPRSSSIGPSEPIRGCSKRSAWELAWVCACVPFP